MILFEKLLFGSCWGSFLGYLTYCYIAEEKVSWRHSRCDFCQRKLRVGDLVPLFSYIAKAGKCRYCQEKIKTSYFLSELITAVIFACLPGFDVIMLLLVSALLLVAFIDYYTMYIPSSLLLIIMALCLLQFLISQAPDFRGVLLGISLGSGMMGLFNLFRKDCFGSGDIKLMALVALVLGRQVIEAMLLAVITAGLVAAKKKYWDKSTQQYLAFAPYLVFGIIINLLGIK